MVRNVYLRNRPNRPRYGREKGGKFKFGPFHTEKRRLFWPVLWPCMVPRWCPMQFGDARWSLGGPGWSPGTARGLPGGYRSQNECFRKFGKRCFWPPGTKRGGLGGILPPILGRTRPPGARRGVWGDPPPILGTKLAIPWCQEGGLGGSSPHYRDKIGPPGVKRGSGGILSPF